MQHTEVDFSEQIQPGPLSLPEDPSPLDRLEGILWGRDFLQRENLASSGSPAPGGFAWDPRAMLTLIFPGRQRLCQLPQIVSGSGAEPSI